MPVKNVGAGKLDRVGKGLKSASFIGGIYAIIAFFVLSLFGRQIALLFVSADEIAILDHVKQFLVSTRLSTFRFVSSIL